MQPIQVIISFVALAASISAISSSLLPTKPVPTLAPDRTAEEKLRFLLQDADRLHKETDIFLHQQRRLGHEAQLHVLERYSIDLEVLIDDLKNRLASKTLDWSKEKTLHEIHQLEVKLIVLSNDITEEMLAIRNGHGGGQTTSPLPTTSKVHSVTAATPTSAKPVTVPSTPPTTTRQATRPPPPTEPPIHPPPITDSPNHSLIHLAQRTVTVAHHFLANYHGADVFRIKKELTAIEAILARVDQLIPNSLMFDELERHTAKLKNILLYHGIYIDCDD